MALLNPKKLGKIRNINLLINGSNGNGKNKQTDCGIMYKRV